MSDRSPSVPYQGNALEAGNAPRVSSVSHLARRGKGKRKMMRESNEGMTVLICENLGKPALLIRTTGAPMLLLSADLTCEERIKIMNRLLDPDAA